MMTLQRFACLLLLVTSIATSTRRDWSTGTAYTLPAGRWEIGLFQPLRYGQTDRLEWSTHPIFDFLIPNATVKIQRPSFKVWDVATRHSLVYPTPLLRAIRRKGAGGIIAADPTIPRIPHMISSRNEVLLTRQIGRTAHVTIKTGMVVGVKFGELDERTTIDFPIVFQRMGVYYRGFGVNMGGDLMGRITKRIGYLLDVDISSLAGGADSFAFEHKGMVLWSKSDRFQIVLGYKLVYGEYPFGTQWYLLPLIDLQWARVRKNAKETL